jgi:hypothetical protein
VYVSVAVSTLSLHATPMAQLNSDEGEFLSCVNLALGGSGVKRIGRT